jgi:hypothetical protein
MDKANLSQLKEARSMLHSLRQRNATIDSDLEFFRSNKDALSNFFSMANNHAEGLKGFIESTDSQAVAEKLLAKSRPEDRPAVTFVIENRKELAHLADHFRLDRPDRDGMPVGITSIDIVEFLGDNSKEIGRIAHFVNAHPKEMDEVLDILQEKAKKGQNPGFKDFLSHPGLAWFAVRNAGELNHIRLFVEKNMDSFDGYSVAQNSKELGEVISFAQRHRPDFPKLAAATAWL